MAKKKINLSADTTQGTGASESTVRDSGLVFGKKNFMYMGIGILLIIIGYFLMAGGSMPSPDVWDESLIYSSRRTIIAPIFILAGLGIQLYTIFAKK